MTIAIGELAMNSKWWKKNPWLISDTHFFHQRIVEFNDSNGKPVRPWNDHIEMTEELISNWNETVAPDDLIIHLGDIAFGGVEKFHEVMKVLNGKKVLVMGNHDTRSISEYMMYFDDVRSMLVIPKGVAILTHIPVHPDQLRRFGKNIHGHLHTERVKNADGSIDERYINVCVEQTNYRPIRLDEVLQ